MIKKSLFLYSLFTSLISSPYVFAATNVDSQSGLNSAWSGGGDINIVGDITFTSTTTSSKSTATTPVTVDGDGHTINADLKQRIFNFGANAAPVTFLNTFFEQGNAGTGDGGAVYAQNPSSISFGTAATASTNQTKFIGNQAGQGGAIAVFSSPGTTSTATLDFYGTTLFASNNSTNGGGAISLQSRSAPASKRVLTFHGDTTFLKNVAGGGGGAISSSSTADLVFAGNTLFDQNEAGGAGGAIGFSVNSDGDSSISFGSDSSSQTVFTDNSTTTASPDGGAINFVTIGSSNIDMTFNGATTFDGNKTQSAFTSSGGAINIQASGTGKATVTFGESATFNNNQVQTSMGNGGALAIRGNSEVNVQNAVFINNSTAGGWGGAVYVSGSSDTAPAVFNYHQTSDTVGGIFQGNTQNGGQSNAIYMADNARVNFDTDAGTAIHIYDGVMSDNFNTGVFTKSGDGTLNLYGDVQLTNANRMFGSTMNLNGGTTALMDSTNFAVQNLNLQNAVLDTHNRTGYGAIDVVKNFTMDANSTLRLKVSDSDRDYIKADTATLAGTLDLVVNVGTYNNYKVSLVETTQDRNTNFSTLQTSDSTLTYDWDETDSNHLYLTINGQLTSTLSAVSKPSYNARQAAVVFDAVSGTSTGDLSDVITELENLPSEPIKNASLLEATPYFVANMLQSKLYENNAAHVYGQTGLDTCSGGCAPSGVWAKALGSFGRWDGNSNSSGTFKKDNYGLVFGADKYIGAAEDFLIGGYGKIEHSDFEQRRHDGRSEDVMAGVYGAYITPEFEIKSLIGAGAQYYDTKRDISYGSLQRTAKADFWGYKVESDIEAALKFKAQDNLTIHPYVGVNANVLGHESFDEKGAGALNVSYDGNTLFSSQARIGLGGFYDVTPNNTVMLNAEYGYLLTNPENKLDVRFAGTDMWYNTKGLKADKSSFKFSGYWNTKEVNGWHIFAGGDYTVSSGYSNLAVNLGLQYSFCSGTCKTKRAK